MITVVLSAEKQKRLLEFLDIELKQFERLSEIWHFK